MQRAKEDQYTFQQPSQCKRQQRATTERLNSRVEGNRGTQVPSPATKTRGQLLAQERDIERLRAEGHTVNCQFWWDLDSSFRNELEKMKDNETIIAHRKNKKLTVMTGLEQRLKSFTMDQVTLRTEMLQQTAIFCEGKDSLVQL
jgi:hypothetical protein